MPDMGENNFDLSSGDASVLGLGEANAGGFLGAQMIIAAEIGYGIGRVTGLISALFDLTPQQAAVAGAVVGPTTGYGSNSFLGGVFAELNAQANIMGAGNFDFSGAAASFGAGVDW